MPRFCGAEDAEKARTSEIHLANSDDSEEFSSDEKHHPPSPTPRKKSPTMPQEISDIKSFIEICRRKDASCMSAPNIEKEHESTLALAVWKDEVTQG